MNTIKNKLALFLVLGGLSNQPSTTQHKDSHNKKEVVENQLKKSQGIAIENSSKAYQILAYKYSVVENSTPSYKNALEGISLNISEDYRGHITACSFVLGEDNEIFIAYKIDGTEFIASTKAKVYNGGNFEVKLDLIDFDKNGLDELCITFSEMDINNGFDGGFELEAHSLLILDVHRQKILVDNPFSYSYMEYTDNGEEDDVHGKMDEDSEVDYCYQPQKFSFTPNGFSIAKSSKIDRSSEEFCAKVIPEGKYTYNVSTNVFEIAQ